MSITSLATIWRLTLHAINRQAGGSWSNKDIYVFYLEIINDLTQSAVYITFFIILLYKYGIPIHLIRDLFLTAQRALKRIMDFYNYRKNMRNLQAYVFF
jgi:E3 ubiquitin-protein ligase synoviolin